MTKVFFDFVCSIKKYLPFFFVIYLVISVFIYLIILFLFAVFLFYLPHDFVVLLSDRVAPFSSLETPSKCPTKSQMPSSPL